MTSVFSQINERKAASGRNNLVYDGVEKPAALLEYIKFYNQLLTKVRIFKAFIPLVRELQISQACKWNVS